MSKSTLSALALFALLSFTACKKDAVPNSSDQSLYAEMLSAKDEAPITAASIIPPFDDQVYDNDLAINTALIYAPKGITPVVLDSTVNLLNGNYSNSFVSGEDVQKPAPTTEVETVSSKRDAYLCQKECRQLVAQNYADTIQLHIKGYRYTSYKLRFEPLQFVGGYFNIRLLDTYSNTYTTIPLTGVTSLPITVSSLSNSSTRFKLVINR